MGAVCAVYAVCVVCVVLSDVDRWIHGSMVLSRFTRLNPR
jgi:hypothetical protein